MSWRMMLRSRTGQIRFRVVDKATGTGTPLKISDYLTTKQSRRLAAYPDFIWQFARRIREEYARNGKDVAIYVDSRVSINGRPLQRFIDPDIDLGSVPWKHFSHHEWILPSRLKETKTGSGPFEE